MLLLTIANTTTIYRKKLDAQKREINHCTSFTPYKKLTHTSS